ncbi:MAG: DUF5658 family protein [Bryobacteraceae bacterium]
MLLATFLCLQLLDFLTTLVGLNLGAGEACPLIRFVAAAGLGPTFGVVASKLVALALGGVCIGLHRPHVIRWINYWYAGLAAWNIVIIVRLTA